ncbi:membrane protein [Meyerozyma sp. JA9]|nr:membrane protein [Meyerozyma sp. JA9]
MEANGPPQGQGYDEEVLSSNLPTGYNPDEPEVPVSRQLTMRSEESLAESLPSGYAEDSDDTQQSVLRQRSAGRTSSLSASLPDGYYDESEKASPIQLIFFVEPGFKTWLNILNGSIWGVLARRGLEALTTYDGSYLSGVVWANFAACVVMGMLVESQKVWKTTENKLQSVKASLPLYVGAATGFCGTLSSFSSFILEMFYKSTNTEPTAFSYPNRAYGIMEFLAVGIIQVTVSLGGFYLGSDVLRFSDQRFPSMSFKTYQLLEWVSMVVGVAAYIANIVLIAVKNSGSWRSWTFSVLFAPFGAWARFYVSRWFNTRIKGFPLGTFIVNFAGTLLLSIFVVLSRGKTSSSQLVTSVIACQVLEGLSDGFCGAFTTVSTFAAELAGLTKSWHFYRYLLVSIVASYAVTILIAGSYNWTRGFTSTVCS